MSFYDSAAAPNWLDYIGLLVGVAGFVIALAQIRRVEKSADSALRAIREARNSKVRDQVLGLRQFLDDAHADLDRSSDNDNLELAHVALVRLSTQSRVAAQSLRDAGVGVDLPIKLDRMADRALDLKEHLYAPRTNSDPIILAAELAAQMKVIEFMRASVAALIRQQENEPGKGMS